MLIMTREATTALLNLAEEIGDYEWLAREALEWLSEDQVREMAEYRGWLGEHDDL
jgi:hypothetical protein